MWDHWLIDALPLRHLALVLLHFLWQGAALAILYALARLLLRRHQPQTRYNFGLLTLSAMVLALPITYWWLREPLADPGPLIVPSTWAHQHYLAISTQPIAADADVPARGWTALVSSVLPWLVAAWIALALVFVGGVGWSWLNFRRQLRRGVDEPPIALDPIHALIREAGMRRKVRLRCTTALTGPATIGWFRPLVLMPPNVLQRLSPDHVRALVEHELAHVRRQDYPVNVLQTALEMLLFFHPAVWWVSWRVREERENVCDDIASAAVGDRTIYAEALAALEEVRLEPPRTVLLAAGGALLGRILRLLGEPLPRADASRRLSGGAAVLAGCFIAIIGANLLARGVVPLPPRGTQQVSSFSAGVYQILNLHGSGAPFLDPLRQTMRFYRDAAPPPVQVTDDLARALNVGADPDALARLVLPRMHVNNPFGYEADAGWEYGAYRDRVMLIQLVWQRAQQVSSGDPALAKIHARAALLLSAQESTVLGPATFCWLLRQSGFAQTAQLSSTQIIQLHRHVEDHLLVSRVLVAQRMRAEAAIHEASSPAEREQILRDALGVMLRVGQTRSDAQWVVASLIADARRTLPPERSAAVVSSLALPPSAEYQRWLGEALGQIADGPPPRRVRLMNESEVEQRLRRRL